jgi:hypothetical protein
MRFLTRKIVRQDAVCRIASIPLPHLAATRWCGTERIFFNAVGAKVASFEMMGNPACV